MIKRLSNVWQHLALGLLGLASLGLHPVLASPLSESDQHTVAINAARAGRYAEALDTLAALQALAPQDRKLAQDRLRVLVWAGDYATAWDLQQDWALADLPSDLKSLIALAARRTGHLDQALEYYRAAIRDLPKDVTPHLGYVLTLTDAGDFARAEAALATTTRTFGPNAALELASAYLRSRQGLSLAALRHYQAALHLVPASREAAQGQAASLRALGALERADQLWAREDKGERRVLAADRAAQRLRWAEQTSAPGESGREDLDRALFTLERLGGLACADLDIRGALEQRLCLDAMAGLRDRQRPREVLRIAQRLRSAGVELPSYGRVAYADALLATRQAPTAVLEYRAVLAQEPDHPTATASLFYALIDSEDFNAAFALLDTAIAQPSTAGKVDLQRLAALGRLYADHLAAAEARLEDLIQQGHGDDGIRLAQAATARARGHPRAAAALYGDVAKRDPVNLTAQLGQVETDLDRGALPQAATRIDRLNARDPEHPRVLGLNRSWYAMQQAELVLDARLASSEGPQIGSSDVQMDGWLFAPPQGLRHRPYLRTRILSAKIPGDEPSDRRLGAGLESTWRDLRTRVEATQGLSDVQSPSLALFTRWRPSDHWEFDAALEANTLDLPLRAATLNDTAGGISAGASYRWHESARCALGLRYLEFSDDNDRYAWQSHCERGFWLSPWQQIRARLEVSGSSNSRRNRNYFNPENDLYHGLSVEHSLRLWRHYERSFRQRIRASVGGYHQEDFGRDTLWSFAYQQEFTAAPSFALIYGIATARKVYDGGPEDVVSLYGNLNARF